MKQKLSWILSLALFLSPSLSSCHSHAEESQELTQTSSAVLQKCEDLGQEYQDSFVFLGESTTYHLKSRGVLSGGMKTTQVWGPKNGTINLDATIASLSIVYPESGELVSLTEALQKKKPKRILLCFGLNGAVGKIHRGKEDFQDCYRILLDLIRTHTPNTQIFLQSAFPVAENMNMELYSVDVNTLNDYIDTINSWSAELAEEYDIGYLNTAEVLKDAQGRLKMEYQSGDGHHLTVEAYHMILDYIRTHGTVRAKQ